MPINAWETDSSGRTGLRSPSRYGYAGGAPGSAHSILVVDDNADALTAFALLLRYLGHEVEEAHDGVSALAIARRMRPTVIFLDLNMPRMGGHEVARALRADPAFSRTLIVAVSGFGQPNDVEAARAAGFDHYIVKPYDLDFVKSLLGPRVSQPIGSKAGSKAGS